MPKSLKFFPIALIILLFGCESNDMPSDHQMSDNFYLHESAFERLKNISLKYGNFHYPPCDETDSIACIVSAKDKKELDSLIRKTGVIRVSCDDSTEVCMLFHTWGLSVSGGYKEYVYTPYIEDNIKKYNKEVASDSTTEMYIVQKITEEDLNQVAQRYPVNLELYRPIKTAWYIHLSREN
jgi:hypothetical protein